MTQDLSKRAREIIDHIEYMTIASITPEGKPWNSPVFAVHDEDYTFYFGTHEDSQKARNIATNPDVFVVIYDSTVPSGTGEGVYFEGLAERLVDTAEIDRAFDIMQAKHDVDFWKKEAITDGPIGLYRIRPSRVWMNDDSEQDGHYIDVRTEVSL